MKDATFREAVAIKVVRRKLAISAFAYANTWGGVSQMLARHAIGNTNPFTLKRPIEQPNETFIAAVSWAESSGYVFRLKLTENIGEVLYFPLYDGQQIGANAYLEIWNVNGEALASISDSWTLTCSKLAFPDLCYCLEGSDIVQPAPITGETLPPYHHCNPFCSPLCT